MSREILRRMYGEDGVVKRPVRIAAAVCVLALLSAGAIFLYNHSPVERTWLVCIWHRLTGYYCPGCGAGRASYSILHGQFYQAFRYNPLFFLLLPFFAIYGGVCAARWLSVGRVWAGRAGSVRVLYGLYVVILLYGIARNIQADPFCWLAPTRVM